MSFDSDGVRLHGLDWGGSPSAAPMLFLHGCGSNAWTFGALAPLLRQTLGGRYHLVAFDQRGGGDSDQPDADYGPETMSRDTLAVQDQLGGQPMVLVGHSRGGWLAAYIAGRWPDRVNRLVLIDPARVRFETREDADEFYGGVRSALGPFPSREAALEQARRREPRARWTPERERAFWAGYRFEQDGSVVGKMPNWVVDRLRGAREGHDDVGPLLGGIGVPVLLLVSSLSNERRQQQKLEYSRRIPRVQVEMLEGTHALQLDLPERVSELIVQFLEA